MRRGALVDTQVGLVFNKPSVALKKPHPYTIKFLAALRKEGLRRVRAHVPVADVERGVATAVDCVCYREADDAVVLIELKCGFEHTDKDWIESYEKTHGLQLAVTERLFRLTYPDIKNLRCMVFRVHSMGVRVHGVCREAREAVDTAIEQVQVRVPKTKKKRRGDGQRRGRLGRIGTKAVKKGQDKGYKNNNSAKGRGRSAATIAAATGAAKGDGGTAQKIRGTKSDAGGRASSAEGSRKRARDASATAATGIGRKRARRVDAGER
jgi:hypothetical protein